jgi:hypothetical protein
MDTPTGIFGLSRKSALKLGGDFNKSERKVRFDESQIDAKLHEIKAEMEMEDEEEIDLEQQKLMAQNFADKLITQLHGLPFGGSFNTPPPIDPRQIMEAREKMNAVLVSSPPRSAAAAHHVGNTPAVNNFNTSRYGPIGEGRPSSSSFQSSYKITAGFGASNNLNASIFNSSNKYNTSSHQASNYFSSSAALKSFNASLRRPTDSYKTALCNQYKDSGTCTYGSDCKYAHGVDELRTPPSAKPNYKTVLCRNFHENGECPHGARCKFIHHRREGNAFQSSFTSNFAASRGRR